MNACVIHLVRHGAHGLVDRVLVGRAQGVALSDMGQNQAAALARHLAAAGIEAVLTSPVQRAAETASVIAASLGLSPQVAPGLEEVDFGAWTGLPFDELAKLPAWAAWNRARGLAPTPGGETMLGVQARAVATLERLRVTSEVAVAVSHSDVIKAVLAHALGMPLDLLHRLEVAPASRSVLVLGEDFARVEAINLPP